MKKIRKTALALAVLMLLTCVALPGCAAKYEVPNYQGQLKEGQTLSDFNKELFYRNDFIKAEGADPFVFDNTQRDGYYYLYVTLNDIFCYRSKDLMNWETVGNALNIQDYAADGKSTEQRNVLWKDIWAPETIYDPDDGRYYMFFSATPNPEHSPVKNDKFTGRAKEVLFVAVSERPDRDFRLVNFAETSSCGAGNEHTIDTKTWPDFFAKYLFFDPAEYQKFAVANGGFRGDILGGYEGGIDPHPYVDENGDKYVFWVDSSGADRISVVKMENWLKPDWSTAKVVACHSFYTVEDYFASLKGESVEKVPYESENTSINEGPQVLKHNDKYYLTFSIGAYSDNTYQVVQAVSDNLMGPYRKLTMEEGAFVLSSELSGSQEVSGPGHHSFVTAGEQLMIVYHRHNDPVVAGGARNAAIDEVKWIPIKDKFGNDLDILYVNGTTTTVQPKFEAFATYKNIAGEATVNGDADVKPLTDGLLSIYKYHTDAFLQYVPETMIQKTTTFTFDFEEARTVRAVMVYNSKLEDTIFREIAGIEFVCIEDGKEVIRYIDNVEFTTENYQANDFDGSIYYVKPGAAAYAEFDELNVKSVRITINVPAGQDAVGISEIRILGK